VIVEIENPHPKKIWTKNCST